MLICSVVASNAAADLNERLSIAMTKAAQKIILKENDLDGIDIEKALAMTRSSLDKSNTVIQTLEANKKMQVEEASRRQEEARFLSDVSAYPFIKLSNVGYLYQIQQEGPYITPPIMADAYDRVRVKIEAHSHDGISLVSESTITTPLTKMHSAFGAMIREMKKGETRKAFLPSSIMFGGKRYLDILPFSTIITTVTLIDIFPKEAKENTP